MHIVITYRAHVGRYHRNLCLALSIWYCIAICHLTDSMTELHIHNGILLMVRNVFLSNFKALYCTLLDRMMDKRHT